MEPNTLSASAASMFETCEARYKASYIERTPEIAGKAGLLGNAVHETLELWVNTAQYLQSWPTLDAEIKAMQVVWDMTYYDYFSDTEHYDDGWEMLRKWVKEQDWNGREVISTEQKKSFNIPTSKGNLKFNYIIDRLDMLDDGSIEIVDYKGLALDTPIPTPEGWTTMGDLKEGDLVIDGNGHPTKVIHKSEVHYNPCYKITFEDNTVVITDHEHYWEVLANNKNRNDVFDYRKGDQTVTWTTEQLAQNLWTNNKRPQRHLRIPHVAVHLPEKELLIDPYVLGAWLGDGNKWNGSITKPLDALFEEIERRGYKVGPTGASESTRTVHGLVTQLKELDLHLNKHIPDDYMRASYSQRLDLLKGLMDADGHWNPKRKRCVLVTVEKELADQVNELICSLGWSATTFKVKANGYGISRDAYQVWFTPNKDVFLARIPNNFNSEGSLVSHRRLIKSIEPIETVPTQCIQVDAPCHTYLCTKSFIKTHNTVRQPITYDRMSHMIQVRAYAVAAMIEYPDAPAIWVTYDLLRYGKVSVKFERDECVRTWKYLRSLAERIYTSDGSKETLNTECRFCVRKQVCETLKKNVNAGGVLSLGSIEEVTEQLSVLMNARNGLDAAIGELQELGLKFAEQEGVHEWESATAVAKIKATGRRDVDSERAAKILGPEIMARYGKVGVTMIDTIIKEENLSDSQKSQLKQLVFKKWGSPRIEIKPKSPFEDE